MSTQTPQKKAQRSKLINRAIKIVQQKQALDAELRAIQDQLYSDFAEDAIEAGTGKTCLFPAPKGSCEVTRTLTLSVPTDAIGALQDALGEEFEDLVKVEAKASLTNRGRRILERASAHEQPLAQQLGLHVKQTPGVRFKFKPAA